MLPFKVKYDPNLDQLYTDHKPKTHSGLILPMRYGLTRKQVEELIRQGLWQEFINIWTAKRRAYLSNRGIICYLCGRVPNKKAFKILNCYICSKCQKQIDEVMNGTNI